MIHDLLHCSFYPEWDRKLLEIFEFKKNIIWFSFKVDHSGSSTVEGYRWLELERRWRFKPGMDRRFWRHFWKWKLVGYSAVTVEEVMRSVGQDLDIFWRKGQQFANGLDRGWNRKCWDEKPLSCNTERMELSWRHFRGLILARNKNMITISWLYIVRKDEITKWGSITDRNVLLQNSSVEALTSCTSESEFYWR